MLKKQVSSPSKMKKWVTHQANNIDQEREDNFITYGLETNHGFTEHYLFLSHFCIESFVGIAASYHPEGSMIDCI